LAGFGRWDGKRTGGESRNADGTVASLADCPLRDEFDELAARYEYEADLPRAEAERRAAEELGLLRPERRHHHQHQTIRVNDLITGSTPSAAPEPGRHP